MLLHLLFDVTAGPVGLNMVAVGVWASIAGLIVVGIVEHVRS